MNFQTFGIPTIYTHEALSTSARHGSCLNINIHTTERISDISQRKKKKKKKTLKLKKKNIMVMCRILNGTTWR